MLSAVDTSADSGRSSPLSSAPSSPLSSAPSSPLSSPANSPSPPPEMVLPKAARARPNVPYPSPPASQQTSQSGSPAPDGMDSASSTDKEGPPPAKRRRVSKERTTEYLDMRRDEVDEEQRPELDRVLNVLHKRQKIVVIAGAGISVSAGSMAPPLLFALVLPLTTCHSTRFSLVYRSLSKPEGRTQAERLWKTPVRRVCLQRRYLHIIIPRHGQLDVASH